MSHFQSEPYKIYLASHTRINQYIKVTTVAVDFLCNSKTEVKELSELINSLILASGERWTPRIISDPKGELKYVKNDLVKSAVVWVYSAFDVFFKQIEGILSSFFPPKKKIKDEESKGESKEHKLLEIYKKLAWETTTINEILPVFRFYEELRHLVVHNFGTPSFKLVEISKSKEFMDAIANWKTEFPKNKISAPPVVSDTAIELKPHHSIIYSETCLRIAKDINTRLFQKLGIKYFVDKTINTHLVNTSSLSQPECINLTRYLVYHLKNDFNILINPYEKFYEYCDDGKSIQEYKKRYMSLKKKQ